MVFLKKKCFRSLSFNLWLNLSKVVLFISAKLLSCNTIKHPDRYMGQQWKNERLLILVSFAIIYIIWGATYLFNYYAIQDIPPFFLCGSRFFLAGILLFIWGKLQGQPWPSWRDWKNTTIIGFFFLTIGVGGVVWAVQFVDTGIASLVVAFEPLLVILLMWILKGKRPGLKSIFGTVLGISGMTLLVTQNAFITDRNTMLGILSIGISILSWATITIYINQIKQPESRTQSAAMQMIGGGALLFLISPFTGEQAGFIPADIGLKAILSLGYLVFLGSILAFSAFNYLLSKVSPEKVATSNYVNPVVALFLGWAFNSEILTNQSLIAAVLLLTGVFFIINRSKKEVG